MSVWVLPRVRWLAWVALVVVISATACQGASRARLPKLLKPECVFPSIQTANQSAALRFGFESLLESDRKAQQHGVPLEARKHLRHAFWAITDSCPDDKEEAYDGNNLARHFTALMLRTIHGVDNLVIPASRVLSFWWQGRKEEITVWSKDPQETVDGAAPSADRELEALDKLLPANTPRLNRTCLDPGTPDVARKLLRSIGATLISSYFQVWDSTAGPERRLAADPRPAVSSLQRDRMLLLLDALTATSCGTDPQAVLQEQFVALLLLARGRAREGNSINPWAEDMQQLRELVPDALTPAEIDMHSRHPLESAWYHRLDAGVRPRFQRLWTLGDIHMQRPWQGASLLAWTVQLHNLTQQWMVPETFLLGAPKAGTTYLWNCVANSGAFSGEEVCASAAGEQRHECLRKHKFIYLGQIESGKGRKEFFFFNNRRLKEPPKQMLQEDHKYAIFGLRRDGLATAITIDGTPNYLADEDAYALVYTSARDPAAQKFIVNLREPVARAFSSWSMFTKWKWRHDTFEECIRGDIKRLYSCWPELKEGPETVMRMPFSLFSASYKRCIRGTWKNTISNGLYALQLRAWLEVYNASQFKFLAEEGLATMQPIQVLEEMGNFLGMEVPQHVRVGLEELKLGQAPAVVKRVYQLCSSHKAQHQSFETGPKGPAVDALQQFYRPWNEYLWTHMVPASVNRTF